MSKNFFVAMKGFLTSLLGEENEDRLIEVSPFAVVKNIITGQEVFEFTEANLIKISLLSKFFDTIYQKIFLYLSSWEFLFTDVNELIWELNKLDDNFSRSNIASVNNKEFIWLKKQIRLLKADLLEIHTLKNNEQWKREDLPALSNSDNLSDIDEDEHTRNDRRIFKILLFLYQTAYSNDAISKKNIKTQVWEMLEVLEYIKNQKQEDFSESYLTFIQDIIIITLYKLWLASSNEIVYYISSAWKKDNLRLPEEIKKTFFKDNILVLKFLNEHNENWHDFQKIIQGYQEDLKNEKIGHLWIRMLLRYYQKVTKSEDWLSEIFSYYKKRVWSIEKDKEKNIMNLIYIANTYFSLLVSNFELSKDKDLAKRIESLYCEIVNIAKWIAIKEYQNYFTQYKYASFKEMETRDKLLHDNITISDARQQIRNARKSIKNAISLFDSVRYPIYFEFETKDYFIDSNLLSSFWVKKIYFPNIYLTPIDPDEKREKFSSIVRNLDQLEWDLKYREKFSEIKDKVEKSKLDVISVVWIFTWLVIYSVWTIQIFSVIETVWTAWLFMSWFSSWILILLGSIYYKSSTPIKQNKWLQLIIMGLVFLMLSIWWKFLLDSEIINWNKATDTYDKLNLKTQEARQLKEILDDRLKRLDLNVNTGSKPTNMPTK